MVEQNSIFQVCYGRWEGKENPKINIKTSKIISNGLRSKLYLCIETMILFMLSFCYLQPKLDDRNALFPFVFNSYTGDIWWSVQHYYFISWLSRKPLCIRYILFLASCELWGYGYTLSTGTPFSFIPFSIWLLDSDYFTLCLSSKLLPLFLQWSGLTVDVVLSVCSICNRVKSWAGYFFSKYKMESCWIGKASNILCSWHFVVSYQLYSFSKKVLYYFAISKTFRK